MPLAFSTSYTVFRFGKKTSSYGPSHSSGVLSFCIQNLANGLRCVICTKSNTKYSGNHRYRAHNLILSAMTPGPTEPTSEQLQNYLKLIVDDILMLYNEGIIVKTSEHPNGTNISLPIQVGSQSTYSGIRVRVALVGIIADHPAMCKLCGFADHSHNKAPCTKCHVPRSEMFSEQSLQNSWLKYTTTFK